MDKNFDYLIASDTEHEEVFIEIYCNKKHVASINQELGIDNLQIEFPEFGLEESLIERKIPLTEFLDLVNQAAKILTDKA